MNTHLSAVVFALLPCTLGAASADQAGAAPIPAKTELAKTMQEPVWDDRSYDFAPTAEERAAYRIANSSFDELDAAGRPASWTVENADRVRVTDQALEGKHAIALSCDAGGRGAVSQVVDAGGLAGRKLLLLYRARVKGSVVPYFRVELADDTSVKVPWSGGGKDTPVLAELHKHGWWPYDGLYGWLFWNDHLPMLYRRGWQTLGGVFTAPAGTQRVRITFEPRPAKYNALERRKSLVASGEVTIDSVMICAAKQDVFADAIERAAAEWAAATYSADEFAWLSYAYNQSMIAKARLDMRVWEALRAAHYCGRAGIDATGCVRALQGNRSRLDDCYAQLAGLRRFYEEHCAAYAARLDLRELQEQYPLGHAGPVGTTATVRTDYCLSLYVERLLRNGFAPDLRKLSELEDCLGAVRQAVAGVESDLRALVRERMDSDMGRFPFPAKPLDYGEVRWAKRGGESPFFFATGNTGFPYRVYKDLGVDVVSINYYSADLIDEAGKLKGHPSIARILKEQGQKQYNAMFFPAHYHFAVPNAYIEKHGDDVAEMLRIDKNGNSPIRLRDAKFARHSRTKFEYDPSYTHYLPISIMHPGGRDLLKRRLKGIGEHIARPENRDTLARLELGAENVNLLAPAHDIWTKAAFRRYVADKYKTVEEANTRLQTDFGSLDDIRYWDLKGCSYRRKVRMERLKAEFMAVHNVAFHEEAIAQLAEYSPDLPVSDREDALWFKDYSYLYAQKGADLIDYHALYDRAYGYYLGRCVGKDHVTGEDLVSGRSGLRTRDTAEQAFSKLLVTGWRQASWGTKSLCIWNLYRDPYYIGAASCASLYSLINENWAALPQLKRTLRRFQDILNGRIATPRTVFFQFEAQGHVSWYLPSIYSTVSFLKANNIDYGYSFEAALKEGKDRLSNYRLIFAPPSLFVSEELQRQFLDWVAAGGVLVTFGPLGLYDEVVNDSQLLMDAVFGEAHYHLIGSHEDLANYDGLYLTLFKDRKPTVEEFAVDEVRPLPEGDAPVYEKVFNNPRMIRGFRPDAAAKRLWRERMCAADFGKGRVVHVPREVLPAEYAAALLKAARLKVEDLAAAWAAEDGFEMMTRFHRDEAAHPSPYVFIQNKDEWQGCRETRVFVRGAYEAAYDVGVPGGFPVALDRQGNVTSFSVRLFPGELAVMMLVK